MRLQFRLEAGREKGPGKVLPSGPLSPFCGSIWASLMATVVVLFYFVVVVGTVVVVFVVLHFDGTPLLRMF